MTPAMLRAAAGWLTVVLALAAGATVATPWPTPADAAGDCDGVWVVVDASELGGPQSVRCAEGDPASGLAALTAAGHDYGFVPRIPGMVCTIDARPDPCNGAPADAYWSYWHAEAGGSWTYASRGAGERDPQPGSVEGWAFGAGSEPGIDPPAAGTGSDEGEASGDSGERRDTDDAAGSDGSSGSTDAQDADDAGSPDATSSATSSGTGSGGEPDGDSNGDPNDHDGEADDGQTDAEGSSGDADVSTGLRPGGDPEGARWSRPDDAAAGPTEDDQSSEPNATASEDGADDRSDDRTDERAGDRADAADEVTIAAPSGGGWAGVATGTTLVAALAGGAWLHGRRRRLEVF